MNSNRLTWKQILEQEVSKEYFQNLKSFVRERRKVSTVYPPHEYVFHAFAATPFSNIKVVILGQDPYHQPNQAHGLAFSVQTKPIPSSLQNIFKEVKADIGSCNAESSLIDWAGQGVFLLNTTLTVEESKPLSHKDKGWEQFTHFVLDQISQKCYHNIVFMLWGKHAQQFAPDIDQRHLVLRAAHPSGLSAHRGFFGCRHFSQANEFLIKQGLPAIVW